MSHLLGLACFFYEYGELWSSEKVYNGSQILFFNFELHCYLLGTRIMIGVSHQVAFIDTPTTNKIYSSYTSVFYRRSS